MAEQLENELTERPENSNGKDLWRWLVVIGWVGMMIFAFHASTHMVGAGDTWVAEACGRHFINYGVDTVEPFSANSHKAGPTEKEISKWPDWAQWITQKVGIDTVKKWHPTGWVNQNWLTHVIFYGLTHLSPIADADPDNGVYSYNSLVYWKIGLYVLSIICIYYTGRILGANAVLSAVFACFALFVGRSFLDIRPAGFSNLLVAAFLLILALTTYRHILYIWLVVPLTVFWCNVHGGYIYVFIMLAPFVLFHFIAGYFPRRCISIGKSGLVHTIAAGAVTLVACILFNPFHLTNFTHTFVISVSKHAEMWRTVHEWHPGFAWRNPVGTGFPFLVLFIMSIGLVVFWLLSRLMKPRQLKAPVNELKAQERQFGLLCGVLGYSAAIFGCWISFISLSFCHADVASFLICVAFVGLILLSIKKHIHFIWLLIPLTLFVVWASKGNKGYSGRYIYPFLIVPYYVVLHIVISLVSSKSRINRINIVYVVATAVIAIVLMMVLVNPFGFKGLSEGLGVYLTQYLTIERIWKSQYEANLGFLSNVYSYLFSGLYAVNLISVVVFLLAPEGGEVFAEEHTTEKDLRPKAFELPQFDIAFLAIAALTVYMAYRSRRFIPIAAFAACPVAAMFIDHIIRNVSASRNFYKKGILAVSPMPKSLQRFFLTMGMVLVFIFGGYWGWKFKVVYLDPWPLDRVLTSVFMRMTASHAKPFFALKFIKANKLSGKMFNYWTEGGFIAYGQEPDPETGKTPLQLFMDGRAQAAYDPKVFMAWSEIMAGTRYGAQIVGSAQVRGRELNAEDYLKIGGHLSKALRKHDVWVVMMPQNNKTEMFIRSLNAAPGWITAFCNQGQRILVDIETEKGKSLYEGIFNGETVFPDEFSKNFTIALDILARTNDTEKVKQGLEYAAKALEQDPSTLVVLTILSANRFDDHKIKAKVFSICNAYFNDFVANKDKYINEDGYFHRLAAAARIGAYLVKIAYANNRGDLVEYFNNQLKLFSAESLESQRYKTW